MDDSPILGNFQLGATSLHVSPRHPGLFSALALRPSHGSCDRHGLRLWRDDLGGVRGFGDQGGTLHARHEDVGPVGPVGPPVEWGDVPVIKGGQIPKLNDGLSYEKH